MYLKRLSELGYKSSTHSIQCFDGVWAFALALNQTITGPVICNIAYIIHLLYRAG